MDTYDYIIIGAGSAGCVLARRLSDNPGHKVLLLEAGPPADTFWVHTPAGMAKMFFHEQFNWNYHTEPMPRLRQRRMYWPRGRGLGGSSAINGLVYIRGHRNDFDHWAHLGNPGWSYEDVLPYFKKMEHNERGGDSYRGENGPLWISDPVVRHPSSYDFIESAAQLGIPRTDDLNGALHDGVGFMQHNIRKGRRHSAYMAYVEPVRHRRNLSVRTGCQVQRILFENQQAQGVEVIEGGQRRVVKAAREVILSAGALNSPQLLMLSGIGPAAHLRQHGIPLVLDAPGVGQNLQDHFYLHCSYRCTPGSSYNREISGMRKYWQGLRYLVTRGGYLALGSSQVAAFVKSRPEEAYADLQISFRPMTFTYHPNGVIAVDPVPSMAASVYRLRPKGSGSITLRSADPMQAPVFTPNFLSDPEDIHAMIQGIRRIREIMSTGPVAARVIGEHLPGPGVQTDEQMLDFMEKHGNSAFHPAGTCKMGRDPMAVVDERLRVRGVERLRVVDASIMPMVTSGNTNAPTMMIGEKGADLIAQDAIAL
ncbi:choline dehydrogenase [Ramlibacter sp. 2FC]|uniref:GMC family oxidoreductase n=1 Tax=Ramlibacter sp. 2FC TaxID=2502188 RepID=UPI0010F90AB7|nr:choline dehydrogenase [Ramlibacter sp. 2FC]